MKSNRCPIYYAALLSREEQYFLLMYNKSLHLWSKPSKINLSSDIRDKFNVDILCLDEDITDWIRNISDTAIEGKIPIVSYEGLNLLRVTNKALEKKMLIEVPNQMDVSQIVNQ